MSRFVIPADAETWVEGARKTDFPIQNLPFGQAQNLVVAIGDQALDLQALLDAELLDSEEFPALWGFYDLPEGGLSSLRKQIYELLRDDCPALRDNKALRRRVFKPLAAVDLQVPIPPNAFVDFYSGIHHASNVGRMFRPDQPPLLPNYRHVPIAYNGRASTVVVSGTDVRRPRGQSKAPDAAAPHFGPTQEMDFELEMGFYLSHGVEMGRRITCKDAEEHILGVVIVNDWSARDFQRWEYQPLGPFLAKSFDTTVSPWVVTLDALEPFRRKGMDQDPDVLPYLRRQGDQHFDITLEVSLKTARAKKEQVICRSNTLNLYWSMAQQLAHVTSNGCQVDGGDLYASGTISGENEGEFGSMLEMTWRGSKPLVIAETGETRTFLEDNDVVIMRAYAQGEGYRIGFGECRGRVIKAWE